MMLIKNGKHEIENKNQLFLYNFFIIFILFLYNIYIIFI